MELSVQDISFGIRRPDPGAAHPLWSVGDGVGPLLKWTAVSLIEDVVVLKPLEQLCHLQM